MPAIPNVSQQFEEEQQRRQSHQALFDVKVGWAYPSDDEELFFNVHLHLEGKDWREILLYQSLAELNNLLGLAPGLDDSFSFPSFPLIDADQAYHFNKLLRSREFSSSTIKLLDNHLRLLEAWFTAVLEQLPRLNDDSKRYVKQLFFREDKASKFENLLEALKSKRAAEMIVPFSSKTGKTMWVLKSMGKLFLGGGGGGNAGGQQSEESVGESAGDRMSVSSNTQATSSSSSRMSFSSGKRKSIVSLNQSNLEKVTSQDRGQSHSVDYEARSDTAAFAKQAQGGSKDRRKSIFGNVFQKRRLSAIGEDLEDGGGGGGSEVDSQQDPTAPKSALDVANKSVLLRIEVQRAEASMQGYVVYDITIRVIGKKLKNPMIYTTSQRYSNFKKLFQQFQDIHKQLLLSTQEGKPSAYSEFIHMIKAPFPFAPMKCYLGLSLSDSELSQRTRLLDEWFREVCFHYRNMPSDARVAIRQFLNFDMSQQKDIFFQDQLAWGTIEMQSGHVPILIVNQSVLDNVPDELMDEIETMTQKGGPNKSRQSASFIPRNSDKFDRQSVRSGKGENAILNDLIWETASQGGASKVSKRVGEKASRTVLLAKAKDY